MSVAAPLRALLVDDEPPARRWLRKLLSTHPRIKVEAEAGDVPTAIEIANRTRPDVLFLDVQMPPKTGFDLLQALTFHPRIIFVTAYDSFAIKAFEANAMDYLLKPVHPDRLAESIRRLFVPEFHKTPPLSRELCVEDLVPLRDRGILRMVTVRDIAAICAEAAYSRVLLSEQPSMLILRRISEWEQLLPNPPFARINRSLLVNLASIRALQTRSRNECQLELKNVPDLLTLGRTASFRLRHLLNARNSP